MNGYAVFLGVFAQSLTKREHISLVSKADLAIVSSLDQMLGYTWVTESPPPCHVESFPMLQLNLGRLRLTREE